MKPKPIRRQRGQALIVIVLAMTGLIAITGLAVDGGMVYASRRQAQNAADAAAMAGSLARIQAIEAGLPSGYVASNTTDAARSRAASNGYNNDGSSNTVEVFNPPTTGYYSNCGNPDFDCDNYVQVIITSRIRTYFAAVVGITRITNQVQAVALAKGPTLEPPFEGNALVSLKPTSNSCSGDFILGGSGIVEIGGGGIFVNSDNETCAFKQDGCNVTLDADETGVTSVGGMNLSWNCLDNLGGYKITPADPIPFPPEETVKMPAACSGPNGKATNNNDGTTTLAPGSYDQFPPKSAKDIVQMQAGVYCVDYIKVANAQTITGDNVFIYVRNGGYFSFQGGTTHLTADSNGDYRGLLIYVATDFKGSPKSCTINGNTTDIYTGTIYAPFCNITINGNSNPAGFSSQVIGYEMKLNGSALLKFVYDPNSGWKVLVPPKLGIFK